MGKVRNASNTLRTGRIGENTWYVRDGEQIVRQRLNNSNYGEGARRSMPQQTRRAKWGNLVNFFKLITDVERSAYENKERGVTDYNMFMKLNANSTPIYLTRQQVEAGGSVCGEFTIAQGSLPAISVTQASESSTLKPWFATSLWNASVAAAQTATMGEFFTSLCRQNPELEDGDALGFVFVSMAKDSNDIPRCLAKYVELVIDKESTTPLDDVLAGSPMTWVPNAQYFTFETLDVGGEYAYCCAVIHTRKSDGGLKVSTSAFGIIENGGSATDFPDLTEFTNDAAKNAAIESYGVDGSVIIAPGN